MAITSRVQMEVMHHPGGLIFEVEKVLILQAEVAAVVPVAIFSQEESCLPAVKEVVRMAGANSITSAEVLVLFPLPRILCAVHTGKCLHAPACLHACISHGSYLSYILLHI